MPNGLGVGSCVSCLVLSGRRSPPDGLIYGRSGLSYLLAIPDGRSAAVCRGDGDAPETGKSRLETAHENLRVIAIQTVF